MTRFLCILLLQSVVVYNEDVDENPWLSKRNDAFKYQNPAMWLDKDYVLMEVTYSAWDDSKSMCLRTTFISKTGNAFHHKVQYRSITPISSDQRTLEERESDITIAVKQTPGSQPKIRIRELGEKVSEKLPLSKGNNYPVLYADLHCIILGAFDTQHGQTPCTMWVPNDHPEDTPRHCRFIMLSECGTPVLKVYEKERHICDFFKQIKESKK
uniref:Secreted protein n=1 Tax=Amblyomma triste TaxID=251400 RepID=A0A023G8Y2_AMBTT